MLVGVIRPCLTLRLRPQMERIKSFAFLDLETTGLPFMENNKTKITELTVMTVHSEHLALGVVPRVQNKLSLCFNPRKLISGDSEAITGLSNYLLEHLAPFTSSTVQMINNFFEHSPKPICMVAHNGNYFDYPILRTEIEKTGQQLLDDILCIDSLEAFRYLHAKQMARDETKPIDVPDSVPMEFQDGFDDLLCKALEEYESETDPMKKVVKKALDMQKINETTPKRPTGLDQICCSDNLKRSKGGNEEAEAGNSKKLKTGTSKKKLNFGVSFKLADVYKRMTDKDPVDAHQAENDVLMLAMCVATLGDEFVHWANENARNFAKVPMMVPGRKIGM